MILQMRIASIINQPANRSGLLRFVVAGLLGCILSQRAGAASFDCAHAASQADKFVCADPRLSALDDTLAQSYRRALQVAPDAAATQAEERAWHRDMRDPCANVACLATAYETRIARLRQIAAGPAREFRDRALGIAFSVPAAWSVTPGCHGRRTCLALAGGPAAIDSYVIALEIFPGDLAAVAANHAIFRRTPEGWETSGRTEARKAAHIEGPGWQGIRAVVPCGIADQLGNHPAGGACLWAVVSNGQRSVVADTLGSVPIDGEINRVIESLRFLGE